ncbi:MAG: M1 family aminopeptidase, partial [Deltaproteobacteria bacterium]
MTRKFAVFLFLVTLTLSVFNGFEGHRAMAADKASVYPRYDLSVSFDLKENLIRGDAKITLPAPAGIYLEGFRITSIHFNGEALPAESAQGSLSINRKGLLEIGYEKTVTPIFEKNPHSESVFGASMISEKGIYLTGSWYPRVDGLAFYRLKALVPAGFQAISEADEITSQKTPDGRLFSFSFPHPVQGIDFIANDYIQTKASFRGMDIFTYFLPRDQDLAKQYIEYTKKYLAMDDDQLVPYAYKRFSIIENVFPTGLSMPTFTLLGAAIVRLPFVLNESLGHEITHQWFGNYVYADFEKGNWLEGITNYMADYRYARSEGKGRQYRKKALVDYQSYVNSGNEFPLRKFYQRTGHPSEAIGYGKGMMLFNMLEKIVGKDIFSKSLRTFIEENKWRAASWDDIERVFEKESSRRLDWFFNQWLDRKGVPAVTVSKPSYGIVNGGPTVRLDILQKGRPYRLLLQVKIFAGNKEIKTADVWIDGPTRTFQWAVSEKPTRIVVDGNYEVMRSLSTAELPPVISRLLGSKNRIAVYRAEQESKYAALLQ